jgi:hypothetical protein
MMADPELVGDLLLVGIVLAGALHLGEPTPVGDDLGTRQLAKAIYGRAHHGTSLAWFCGAVERVDHRGPQRILEVLRTDIRRYRPTDSANFQSCKRPMVMREGTCDRNATVSVRLTDPATGERWYVGACSNRPCKAWLDAMRAKNAAELATHPAPVPAANTGGILARHLDEIDWIGLWRALDPTWVIPPEVEAWAPPKLRLVVNDEPEPAPDGGRPALVAIEGGWR